MKNIHETLAGRIGILEPALFTLNAIELLMHLAEPVKNNFKNLRQEKAALCK